MKNPHKKCIKRVLVITQKVNYVVLAFELSMFMIHRPNESHCFINFFLVVKDLVSMTSVLGHCRQNTDLTPPLYRERSGKAFLTFPSKFVLDKDWCYHCAEAIQKRSSLSQKRCPKKGMLRAF